MVFIAHSKKDRTDVLSLYSFLTGWGFLVWLDEKNLVGGQNWEHEIRKAIDKSKAFLICLSSRWVASRGFVHKELRLALRVLDELPADSIYIIPARLDPCDVPSSLKHLHWVDLFKEDGRDKLLAAVKAAHGPTTGDQHLVPNRPMLHSPIGGIFSAAYLPRDPKTGAGQ
jgi:hypothetical protein